MAQPISESEDWQRRHRRRPEYSQRSLDTCSCDRCPSRLIWKSSYCPGENQNRLLRPTGDETRLLEAAESSDLTATSLFSTSGSSHVRQSFRDILHRLSTGSSTNEDLNVLATRFECAVNEQEKARFRRRG